ncbi:hypothetical protein AMIS_59570 [Actinoplanes missouriensis 431]|uniref:Uncharacterized protein n=1 Tax=Actinoplanes missouriensis (strain ATCC 14538 / DSM 43046 / CBS 188.64 / JCM 3121 / NBRC 102363 / NCIMB 12654 / NRRL B-3342 / UNCC 431) TaxID=512565 RepID=I0HDU0_ACTM4|nr:hypothetical protein [Actinoplanes missouriensis]BAL91177.1 hypothetical protein AMIS_59570 [Actinoplanes missouriensis 431]
MTDPQSPPKHRGYLLVITLVVAALSLVVGLAGVTLSAIALGRSDEASALAKQANDKPVAVAPTTEATGEPPTPEPTDPASATPDPEQPSGAATTPADISPTADYTVAYQGEHLRARSVGCNGNFMAVDLDEPRVAGEARFLSEFGVQGCNAPGEIVTNLAMATVSGPSATPFDCLETIRTDPGRSPIAPTQGMTLCLVTDQKKATANGVTQKIVFVTVDSISVDRETVVLNLTLKAWDMPQ